MIQKPEVNNNVLYKSLRFFFVKQHILMFLNVYIYIFTFIHNINHVYISLRITIITKKSVLFPRPQLWRSTSFEWGVGVFGSHEVPRWTSTRHPWVGGFPQVSLMWSWEDDRLLTCRYFEEHGSLHNNLAFWGDFRDMSLGFLVGLSCFDFGFFWFFGIVWGLACKI